MVPPPFLPGLYYVNGVGVAVAVQQVTAIGNGGSVVTGSYQMTNTDGIVLVAAGAIVTMPTAPSIGWLYQILVRSGSPASNEVQVTSGAANYLIDSPVPSNLYDAGTSVAITLDGLNPVWLWTGSAMAIIG